METVEIFDNRYEVSSEGEVFSTMRGKKRKIGRKTKSGYIRVFLVPERKDVFLHRIVAEHFIPNPSKKPYINHKNGIKTDNRAENLEWCSHQENMLHCRDNSLRKSKIDMQVANKIRKTALETGLSQKKIGLMYGLSQSHICDILLNKSWPNKY